MLPGRQLLSNNQKNPASAGFFCSRCISRRTKRKTEKRKSLGRRTKTGALFFCFLGWALPMPDCGFSFFDAFSPSAYNRTAVGRRKRRLHRNPAAPFFCIFAGRRAGGFCALVGREPPKQTVCNTLETNPTHLLRRQSHSSQKGFVPIIQNVENEKILRKSLQCFSFDDILSTIIGVSIGEFCPFLGFYQKNRDFFGIIVGKSYVVHTFIPRF